MIEFRIQHYLNRALQELSFLSRTSIAKPSSVIVVLTNSCNADASTATVISSKKIRGNSLRRDGGMSLVSYDIGSDRSS